MLVPRNLLAPSNTTPEQTDATKQLSKGPASLTRNLLEGPLPSSESPSFISTGAANLPSMEGVDPNDLHALLQTIRSVESSNTDDAYNMIVWGGTFDDYSAHPNVRKYFKKADGTDDFTTAAGAYQITKTTFDTFAKKAGITGFSPKEQDQLAIAILENDGAIEALRNKDYEKALLIASGKWEGLGGILAEQSGRKTKSFDHAKSLFNSYRNGEMGIEAVDLPRFLQQQAKQEFNMDDYLAKMLAPDLSLPWRSREGDASKFADYMLHLDPSTDLERVRAENQSNWEQLGHSIVRAPINAVLGIAEGVGILADIPALASTFFGDGSDYTNWLTEWARSGKEAMNEALPVYRENPNMVWNPGDFAWWVENGEGLIESIASFYAVGAGVGMLSTKIASALVKAADFGAMASRASRAAATLNTAAALAYTEGAMEGARVYQTLYDQGRAKNLTHDQAQQIAAEGAAKTVRMNTYINTALNISGAMALMRPMRSQRGLAKSGLLKKAGESREAYRARLAEDPKAMGFFTQLGREAKKESPQEAFEEFVNQWSVTEGLFAGRKDLGEQDERTFGERFVDTLMDPETTLSMALGAIGGGGQAFVSGLAPMRVLKEGDGEAKPASYKGWTLKGIHEAAVMHEATKQTRLDLIKMIDDQQAALKAIQEASVGVDGKSDIAAYRAAQDKLFGAITMDRIISGAEEQMLSTFEGIAQMTEEEAEKAGFDTNPQSENYYKKLAQDRVEKVKSQTKRWNQIQDTYGFDDDEHLSRLPRLIFSAETELKSIGESLEAVDQFEKDLQGSLQMHKTLTGTDISYAELTALQKKRMDLRESRKIVQKKLDTFDSLMSKEGGKRKLQEKYGTYDLDSVRNNMVASLDELVSQTDEIDERFSSLSQQLRDATGNDDAATTEFDKWVETNQDYAEALDNVSTQRKELLARQAELSQTLKNLGTKKGRKAHTDAFNAELERLKDLQRQKIREQVKQAESVEQLQVMRAMADPNDKELGEDIDKEIKKKQDAALKEEMDLARQIDEELSRDPEVVPEEELTPRRDFRDAEEREDILQLVLQETTRADAMRAFYDFAVKYYNLDDEFIKVAKDYFETLRRAEQAQKTGKPASTKRAKEAEKLNDGAKKPSGQRVKNTHATEEDTDRSNAYAHPRNSETDDRGRKVRVDSGRLVDAATTLAHSSKDHAQIVTEEDGVTVVRKVDITENLNERLIAKTLSPNHLQVGDKVRIVLHKEYVHPVTGETYQKLVEAYPDEPWALAPMAVVDEDGDIVGYLHDMAWISDEVDGEPVNVATESGTNSANWDTQINILKDIRQMVMEQGEVETTIVFHGTGTISHSYEHDANGNLVKNEKGYPKREMRPMSENAPAAKMAVMGNGQVEILPGEPIEEELLNRNLDSIREGQPLMLIPTSRVKGTTQQYVAIQLHARTIKEADPSLSSDIFELIKAFHAGSEEVSKLLKTAFDVSKKPGELAKHLENYFYSAAFGVEDIKSEDASKKKVFFHVGTDTGTVKISRRGGPIYTTDRSQVTKKGAYRWMFEQNSKGEFIHKDAIVELIGEMFINMDIKRANGKTKISVLRQQDGQWVVDKRAYSEFVRGHFLTSVKGTEVNIGKKRFWVYTEQPSIQFAIPSATRKGPQVGTPTGKKISSPEWLTLGAKVNWVDGDGVLRVEGGVVSRIDVDPNLGTFVLLDGQTTYFPANQLEPYVPGEEGAAEEEVEEDVEEAPTQPEVLSEEELYEVIHLALAGEEPSDQNHARASKVIESRDFFTMRKKILSEIEWATNQEETDDGLSYDNYLDGLNQALAMVEREILASMTGRQVGSDSGSKVRKETQEPEVDLTPVKYTEEDVQTVWKNLEDGSMLPTQRRAMGMEVPESLISAESYVVSTVAEQIVRRLADGENKNSAVALHMQVFKKLPSFLESFIASKGVKTTAKNVVKNTNALFGDYGLLSTALSMLKREMGTNLPLTEETAKEFMKLVDAYLEKNPMGPNLWADPKETGSEVVDEVKKTVKEEKPLPDKPPIELFNLEELGNDEDPFLPAYPSIALESASEQLQANGDVRLTCKV